MSVRLSASVDIRASAHRVFEIVCTPERLPEWNVSVVSARRVPPNEAVRLGSRAIFNGRLLGQQLESETEVVEFDPPSRFVTRALRGPRLTTRFELDGHETTTRVYVEVNGEVPGGRLGERLAEGFLRKELTASLDRLRLIGEQEHATKP
jgi:uncharacterized protein YndB with AHSA1/START domain